jgi:hypothetical protein
MNLARRSRILVLGAAIGTQLVVGGLPPPVPWSFAPNSGTGQSTSRNWAGYVATGGSFTSISASWTVPNASASNGVSSDATWVGIGGVTSQDLIQGGTQDIVQNGQVSQQAWIETLPGPSQTVPITPNPGDSMTVSVAQQGSGTWQLTLTDNTNGQNFQTSVAYQSSLSSADWIEEAPLDGRQLLTLDNFGSVAMSGALTVDNGQSVTIGAANGQAITMVGPNDQPVATPSTLGGDGASFSVTRTGQAAGGTPEPRRGVRPRPPDRGRPPFVVVPRRRGFGGDPGPDDSGDQ